MQGWTSRPCPRCSGKGIVFYDAAAHPCDACGGTGQEYDDLPAVDEHPPVREPD
jgi:DnaJ-class molecular chaperone